METSATPSPPDHTAAAQDKPPFLRQTQRAPRSCRACASRKVRCDKAVPCATCIRRGEAARCVRETVIVRGRVTKAQDPQNQPTYEELLRENERLRSLLSCPESSDKDNGDNSSSSSNLSFDRMRAFDEALFASPPPRPPGSAAEMDWDAILLPPARCSVRLVEYDRLWHSWVHYALEYPRFEHEHSQFLLALQGGVPLREYDAFWLALYFSAITAALLTMDDEEADQMGLSEFNHDYPSLLRNWYDAALFCLHRADFLRRPDLRAVQAIAILGICFSNFGDKDLYESLWACAFSLSQRLGLDRQDVAAVPGLGQEAGRRLWWTLLICDWSQMPYRIPIVRDGDFAVALPSVRDGSIDPAHYHAFMARSARVWHRFQAAVRGGGGGRPATALDAVVRRTDDALAEIINTLPSYLQPDTAEERLDTLAAAHPWIVWQRFDVTIVLLHLRLCANQMLLQDAWRTVAAGAGEGDDSPDSRVRSLCVSTAREIIWISHNWHQPVTKRRQWALSLTIFNAAMHLLTECRERPPGSPEEEQAWRRDVAVAVAYLEGVQSHNAVAQKGVHILREALQEGQRS